MKAAVYSTNGSPDVIHYQTVADPVPKADEVLVRNLAISIEGGDLLSRARRKPSRSDHIVGYGAAGEIVALGRDVTELHLGQRVTTFAPTGSHAELRAVRQDCCWLLPEGMDMAAAACIPVGLGTAYQALFDLGQLTAGQTVLVQGAAGGVGLAAVQLAKRAGARVLGTASSTEHLDQLRTLGLDEGIVHGAEDVVQRVRELTENLGVDLAIDPVGGAALQVACDALAVGGRVVMVGMVDSSPHVVNATPLMIGRRSLIGCMLGQVIHQPRERRFIEELVTLVHSGEITVVIDREFPLAEAAAAHRHAETRGRPMGRVVMIP